jgi:hypothetical protein
MARPISQTITTTGATSPVGLDWMIAPFDCLVTVIIPSGSTATYSLQYTQDDLNGVPPAPAFTAATANWVTDPTMSALSVTSQVSLNTPYMFIRLNVSALSGTLLLRIVQGLSIN